MKLTRSAFIPGFLAVSVLALSACGVSNSGSGDSKAESTSDSTETSKYADCDVHAGAKDVSSMKPDEDKKITIGAFNGWDESYAASHLLKNELEKDGYQVKIQSYDAAPGYTGVSGGDIDLIMDGWLPLTHADYIEKYGDKLENLGCWYDNAKLTIAVNEDSPAKTIADLKTMGDQYDNRLVGIEPGAGLTTTTEKKAIPEYGLTKLNFVKSSTPAMLAEVQKATKAKKNIAVTLWRPHWAYDAFPVRDLEDPKGAMGKAENIFSFAREGFEKDHPKAAQIVRNFVLDDEHLPSLENEMFSEENYNGKDNDAAVKDWLKDNPDFSKDWEAGKL